ncbi:MAG: nucleotidyltransferase domain-containing protein [Methanosarcinales archaeon]
MITEDFKAAIFEFIKKVSSIEGIIRVILFGSVARREATKDSDIDLLVIVSDLKLESEILKITHEVGAKYQKNFQILVKTPILEDLDASTLEEIGKDGILLYGTPIILKTKNLELKPYCIVVYSLTSLTQSDKMKFKRAMFGSKSVFKLQGERIYYYTKWNSGRY